MSSNRVLAIVGAGPKALAVSLKCYVLAQFGMPVPAIHIYEQNAVMANWTAGAGFTDGDLLLGTPAEMDIGFPYDLKLSDPKLEKKVNQAMFQFSYSAFLIATKGYSNWILKAKKAPAHKKWAEYLLWVYDQIKDYVQIHFAKVTQLSISKNAWLVTFDDGSSQKTAAYDSVMLTGPGLAKGHFQTDPANNLYSSEAYWRCSPCWESNSNMRIAVIGGGEQAASIAQSILRKTGELANIEIVCARGTALTRGDSFSENRFYVNPHASGWQVLPLAVRKNFIRHTDIGVFSAAAMENLERSDRVHYVFGKCIKSPVRVNDLWRVEIKQGAHEAIRYYDVVILSTGYSQFALANSLFDQKTIQTIMGAAGLLRWSEESLITAIDSSLAIGGLKPKLYWPMIASLNQGPGFSNLSCLGDLSGVHC